MFLSDKYQNDNGSLICENIGAYKIFYDNILNLNSCNETNIMEKHEFTNMPHLIINGLNGSGKNYVLNFILEKIFGKTIYNTEKVDYVITGYSNNKDIIPITQSKYHIVIEPKSSGFDKYLIQKVVKEYADTNMIDFAGTNKTFKAIVINKVDKLSSVAQASLRRTMETYIDRCKFILMCEQSSHVIHPLKSRCLTISVPLPNDTQIVKLMMSISAKENIDLTEKDISYILHKSHNNIDNVIWLLDMKKLNIKMKVKWLKYLKQINDIICSINSKMTSNKLLKSLLKIRNLFYEIFITNVDSKTIMKELMFQLLKSFNDDETKFNIIKITSKYELQLSTGQRHIIHMEAYINCLIDYLVNKRTK